MYRSSFVILLSNEYYIGDEKMKMRSHFRVMFSQEGRESVATIFIGLIIVRE